MCAVLVTYMRCKQRRFNPLRRHTGTSQKTPPHKPIVIIFSSFFCSRLFKAVVYSTQSEGPTSLQRYLQLNKSLTFRLCFALIPDDLIPVNLFVRFSEQHEGLCFSSECEVNNRRLFKVYSVNSSKNAYALSIILLSKRIYILLHLEVTTPNFKQRWSVF